MDANTLFNLICCFILYLPIQSLLINGIYISAAGRSETLPDGTVVGSEMILYPLYRFLNQQTQSPVFFSIKRIRELSNKLPIVPWGTIDWTKYDQAFVVTLNPGAEADLTSLKTWATAYLNAEVFYQSNQLSFYQNIPHYKFSKYIRKPIITCIICMASFWSIFTFLIPVIYLFGWDLKILPIWIGNMFCVSYLNYVIFKPRK